MIWSSVIMVRGMLEFRAEARVGVLTGQLMRDMHPEITLYFTLPSNSDEIFTLSVQNTHLHSTPLPLTRRHAQRTHVCPKKLRQL